MPRTKGGLDLPPASLSKHHPEPSKRSQSVASLRSLPTPPPTRKRKRSRSRHSRATDSGSELDFQDSDDEELERGRSKGKDVVAAEHNKRKFLRVDAIAAELSGQAAEDAFWMGESTVTEIETSKLKGKERPKQSTAISQESTGSGLRSPTRSPSSSPAQMLKRTRTGLLSPPKSHRRRSPRKQPFVIPPTIEEDISTPPPKTALDGVRKRLFPERDSPNNPFLVSDDSPAASLGSRVADGASSSSQIPVPRTPRKHVEKRTLTYVFRGVRQEFDNPLFDHRYPETGIAPSRGPDSPSNLPPEDPNFSPREYCPPQILFPEARTRRRRHVSDAEASVPHTPTRVSARQQGKKARNEPKPKQKSEWDTSDEEELEVPVTPKAKVPRTPVRRAPAAPAAKPPSQRRAQSKAPTVATEAPRTRSRTRASSVSAIPVMPVKDRSDPAKRAFGPRGRA